MRNFALGVLLITVLSGCGSIQSLWSNQESCSDCRAERLAYWNEWLETCAPGNIASSTQPVWQNTTFRTVGVTYEGFQKEDSLDYAAMVDMYSSQDLAQKYLPGVILSGSTYPDQATIKKGESLVKLVKINANISGFSVYYITTDELARIKKDPSRLEQSLGLPLTSNAGYYLIYKLHALEDNVVFQSKVAPTVQYHSPVEAVYWTSGGATQTLVLDNANTTLWRKDKLPSDTLKISVLPNVNQVFKLQN